MTSEIIARIEAAGAKLVLQDGRLVLLGGKHLPAELLAEVRARAVELHLSLRSEESHQAVLRAWRRRQGVEGARDTGPATADDMEQARAELGNPETPEQWAAAVEARRRGGDS